MNSNVAGVGHTEEIELRIRSPRSPQRPFSRRDIAPLSAAYIATKRKDTFFSLIWCWSLEILSLVLLSISFAKRVLPFVVLQTSNCGTSEFYLNIIEGFSSNRKRCLNNELEVCIPWTSPFWVTFENVSGAKSSMHEVMQRESIGSMLYAGQVLYVVCIALCFSCWIAHSILISNCICNNRIAYFLYLASGIVLLLTFFCGLALLGHILSLSVMHAYYWQNFLSRSGVLNNGTVPVQQQDLVFCEVSSTYEGAACLIISVIALLICSIWTLIGVCKYGVLVFDVTNEPELSAYRTQFRAADANHPSSSSSSELEYQTATTGTNASSKPSDKLNILIH